MPQFKTKEEWSAAVDRYKAKHGTTRGFQKGKLQYIDSDGKPWSYAAGSHGGPGHARSASSTDAYTARRDSMEVDQTLGASTKNEATAMFNDAAKNAGAQKGVHQMHHMRTLNQYEPLLAGLNEKDTVEALKWFESEGFPLGNHDGNLLKQYSTQKQGGTTVADTHQGDGSIHKWMRKHRLEPMTNQAEYKRLATMFEGKPLVERLPMYTTYLEQIQGAVQEELQQPTDYSRRAQLQSSVGKIESGPRAGQRLPVNRRTLGDSIIRDVRKGAKWLPLLGIGAAVTDAGSAFAKGNTAEGVAHLVGGAVGEVPVFGDVAVESATGTPTADGTVTGQQRLRAERPTDYGAAGPNLTTPQQSNRAALLRKDPSQERGYETIQRVVQQGSQMLGGWMKKLGIQ